MLKSLSSSTSASVLRLAPFRALAQGFGEMAFGQLVQRETFLALLRCFGFVKFCGCAPALTNQDTRRLILDGSLCVLARTI